METIVFDVFGDLALFRKFYTNTSILTYPFPPPSAIKGLVGAILGIEREALPGEFENIEVSISIKNPVKKIRFSLNYINTKDKNFTLRRNPPRIQVPTEFVKEPFYRIYIRNLKDEYGKALKNLLKEHKSIYTPYLGISELIANFEYVGAFETVDKVGETYVNSVVPLKYAKVLLLENVVLSLFKERVPLHIDEKRIVKEYIDVVIEKDGKPIPIDGKYSVVGEEHVIFF